MPFLDAAAGAQQRACCSALFVKAVLLLHLCNFGASRVPKPRDFFFSLFFFVLTELRFGRALSAVVASLIAGPLQQRTSTQNDRMHLYPRGCLGEGATFFLAFLILAILQSHLPRRLKPAHTVAECELAACPRILGVTRNRGPRGPFLALPLQARILMFRGGGYYYHPSRPP